MSNHFYLSHINDLSLDSQKILKNHGIIYDHMPLVKEKARFLSKPLYTDFAITTSFTAITHIASWLPLFETIYCIGSQSAAYAVQKGGSLNQVSYGTLEAPSLRALMRQYEPLWHKRHGTWYGSSAGLFKHQKLLAQYPNVHVQITHWNWPHYESAYRLSQTIQSGTIICSSISAAIAISSTLWKEDIQIILSSRRLLKFISGPLLSRTRISSHWILDVMDQRL